MVSGGCSGSDAFVYHALHLAILVDFPIDAPLARATVNTAYLQWSKSNLKLEENLRKKICLAKREESTYIIEWDEILFSKKWNFDQFKSNALKFKTTYRKKGFPYLVLHARHFIIWGLSACPPHQWAEMSKKYDSLFYSGLRCLPSFALTASNQCATADKARIKLWNFRVI